MYLLNNTYRHEFTAPKLKFRGKVKDEKNACRRNVKFTPYMEIEFTLLEESRYNLLLLLFCTSWYHNKKKLKRKIKNRKAE